MLIGCPLLSHAPPSTTSTVPVTKEERGLQRKMAASAISVLVPNLRSGIRDEAKSFASGKAPPEGADTNQCYITSTAHYITVLPDYITSTAHYITALPHCYIATLLDYITDSTVPIKLAVQWSVYCNLGKFHRVFIGLAGYEN